MSTRTASERMEGFWSFIGRSVGYWKRGVLVFLLVAGVAAGVIMTKPRIYRSETVVLYQETIRSTDVVGGDPQGENSRRVAARLKEMLLSRASLEPIVKDLPRYMNIADKRGMVDAIDELRSHISFRASREGDTFEIGFDGNSPEEAQQVAKRLGDRIVDEAAARRAEQAKALKEFFDSESERNKENLRAKEAEFAKFLALHPEFFPLTLPGAGRALAPGAPVVGPYAGGAGSSKSADPVLAGMRHEAATIEARLHASKGGAPPPVPDTPETAAARAEVAAARTELADKRGLYTDKHPDVIAAQTRLRNAEAALARALSRQPSAAPDMSGKLTDAEKEALEARLAMLKKLIAARAAGAPVSAPTGAGSSPASVALEVEFRRLQREVEDLRERQKQLDDKQFKASMSASSVMSDRNIQVKILDPAYLPAHPISGSRSKGLAIALVVAAFAAAVTAMLSARLDDRIFARPDLEVLEILPVVGVIPRAETRGRRKAAAHG